jgi:hypothetical protein
MIYSTIYSNAQRKTNIWSPSIENYSSHATCWRLSARLARPPSGGEPFLKLRLTGALTTFIPYSHMWSKCSKERCKPQYAGRRARCRSKLNAIGLHTICWRIHINTRNLVLGACVGFVALNRESEHFIGRCSVSRLVRMS